MKKSNLKVIKSSLNPEQRLTAYHYAIGLKPVDIERQYGVHHKKIQRWLNDAEFRELIDYHINNEINRSISEREKIADDLRVLGKDAVKTLKACMNQDKSWSVKEKACIDILHQIGVKPPEKAITEEHTPILQITRKENAANEE